KLRNRVNVLVRDNNLQEAIQLNGIDPWVLVSFNGQDGFSAAEIKTFFLKEMMNLGVLLTASHNMSYAHDAGALALIEAAYARVLPELKDAMRTGTLRERLDCKLVSPVFQVRP
ncbi:MAG: hypothetical protein QGH33_04645, partial [Pirellulaceae bacterium]|nr:hypothetical protein [Pirellulaceae bacterium]